MAGVVLLLLLLLRLLLLLLLLLVFCCLRLTTPPHPLSHSKQMIWVRAAGASCRFRSGWGQTASNPQGVCGWGGGGAGFINPHLPYALVAGMY